MKPNYARRAMRQSKNTQYRPEQFKLQSFFKVYAPQIHTEMEHRIVVNSEGREYVRIADLVDLDNKIAYFLNGEVHSSKRDNETRILLETNSDWKVTNLDKDSWEWNWLWQ